MSEHELQDLTITLFVIHHKNSGHGSRPSFKAGISNFRFILLCRYPIPLLTSPLKGEENNESPPLQGAG
jgi:hypothetical protein